LIKKVISLFKNLYLGDIRKINVNIKEKNPLYTGINKIGNKTKKKIKVVDP